MTTTLDQIRDLNVQLREARAEADKILQRLNETHGDRDRLNLAKQLTAKYEMVVTLQAHVKDLGSMALIPSQNQKPAASAMASFPPQQH